jgi:hypothetical protein
MRVAKPRLSRARLVRMLKDTGGAEIILTGYDLSGMDLNGLSLTNIIFSDINTRQTADLTGTSFRGCTIRDANFSGAKLSRATFRDGDLRWCDFRYTNIEQCTFQSAYLFGCDFYRAEFIGITVFEEAHLEGVSLYLANLEGAGLRRENLGGRILQENPSLFAEFHRQFSHLGPLEVQHYLARGYLEAAGIYRALVGAWTARGLLRDASWAYVRLKRMETLTYSPRRSWLIYAPVVHGESSGSQTFLSKSGLAARYLPLYLVNLFVDAVCGFGESLWRVIVSFLVLLLGGALFYQISQSVIDASGSVVGSFSENLLFSLGNLVSVSFDNLQPADRLARFMLAAQSLLGIMLVGLFGFILGNKIRHS